MGRRRSLPAFIGVLSDDAVALLTEEGHRPISRQAVRQLRERRGIPPADPAARVRWEARREGEGEGKGKGKGEG